MNDLVKTNSQLPDFLKGKQKTAKIGNIDHSDLIIPRVALLQAISPQVETFDDAKSGEFWHNVAERSMGKELRGVPIVIRKSLVLWAPRGDDRGILARSSDCISWDPGFENKQFTVKPKGSPNEITYDTRGNVAESGLAEFGSSIPGDANSKPAASLTYQMMWYFIDFPELSPAIIINTRSAIKPCQNLLSKIDLSPVDHFDCVYKIGVIKQVGDEGPYNNYSYTADGYVNEELHNITSALFEKFGEANWRANDETDDTPGGGGSGGNKPKGATTSSKF